MKSRAFIFTILCLVLALLFGELATISQHNAHAKPLPSLIGRSSLSAPPMSPPFTIIIRPDNRFLFDPKVVYNSKHGEFLVVWIDRQGSAESTIYGRRVSLSGHTIGEDFVIKPEQKNEDNYNLDVVYIPNHDIYWVVYTKQDGISQTDIWITPLTWHGERLSPIAVDTDSDDDSNPAIVYNHQDDRILVVYDHHISSDRDDLIAKHTLVETINWSGEITVAGGNNLEHNRPDAAYNPHRNNYLIAYRKEIGSSRDIAGKVANSDLSSFGGEISITPGGFPPQGAVKLAAGPDEFLAVWIEEHSETKASLWGRRIGGDGNLHPFIKFAQNDNWRRYLPSIAFGDSGHYLTNWRDIEGASPYNIGGRFVRQGQDALEGDLFYVEHNPYSQDMPDAACGYLTPCLVVYTDYYPYTNPTDFSIRGRLVGHRYTMLPVVMK